MPRLSVSIDPRETPRLKKVVPAARKWALAGCFCSMLLFATRGPGVILWSDLGSTLVHDTGAGSSFLTGSAMDILGGAVREDDTSTNVLYFKFHVDPLSDVSTEKYFAAFQLFEGDNERLGVGNSLEAWAYSAFNTSDTGESNKISGDVDLHSARPETSGLGSFFPYELPRRGIGCTIVFKVQFVAGGDDLVTVWMNPDLGPGATEAAQPEKLTTRFRANCSFDQIRLRHGGGGGGWTFSDMAIATEFSDLVRANTFESGDRAGRGARPVTFQSWQREQGLPQNSVRAILQTHDGYLWIGSDGGLARFDGVRFVPFDTREGVRGEPVSVLFEDGQNALWIGTVGGGLTRLQNGNSKTFTTADGLPSDSITALMEDVNGHLWVGTEYGLAVLENGNFAAPNGSEILAGRTITALYKDSYGHLWLGAAGLGVFQYAFNKFSPLTDSTVDALLRDPHCVHVDKAGRIWVGAGDDYVLYRDGTQWRRYRIPRHLARPYVNAFVEEGDGTVWASSVSEGLFEFREGKVVPVNASKGLLDNFVQALFVDREGNLWVGMAAGLNRLHRSNLFMLTAAEGLGYGAVSGLAEVDPGVIWAAKPEDGVFLWNNRGFARLSIPDAPSQLVGGGAMLKSADGSCWVAGAQSLLRFASPNDLTNRMEYDLFGTNIAALAEDRDRTVWAGARDGKLWRFAKNEWTLQANFVQRHAITTILGQGDGSIWIGTDGGGLFRYQERVTGHYNKNNGLLSDFIRALCFDTSSNPALWIGTAGGGVSQWRNGQISTNAFTTREGLPDSSVLQILDDSHGRLWLGGNRGIARVKLSELNDLADGKISTIYPLIYDRAEGMLSEECTGGFSPAGLKTATGLLWFPTTKGIAVIDPRPPSANAPPPNVVLEEVQADGLPINESRRLDSGAAPAAGGGPLKTYILPPGKHHVELRYTGLSFGAPERIRFRYKLEGLDPDWVEAGTGRRAIYPPVPAGHYIFRVVACNSDGVWNDAGATLDLVIQPHVWQSWWFIGAVAAALLLSVISIARIVEKRKLHSRLSQLEKERALGRERERIAQDLHDDLGSSLARISLLSGLLRSDKDNPKQVETHASKISQSANQTVRALEEIVWAVRPDSDTLQSLVEYIAHFANELFDGQATRCRLDLPHDLPAQPLPPDLRHNIFLVVKEALTNSLKHAGAAEVQVRAKVAANALEISIYDDGHGLSQAHSETASRHHGLANMRRRAAVVGGELKIESGQGRGTTVRLTVPLPQQRPETV